jgi:hypothetical protein
MRAERVSKPTAADVTRAIIIFRNVLIPLGGRPLRDSFSSEIIPTFGGALKKGGWVRETHPWQAVGRRPRLHLRRRWRSMPLVEFDKKGWRH